MSGDGEAFRQLRDLRANSPQSVADRAATRRRRPLRGGDGRLFLLAADHPARNAFAASGNAMAMADREELLRRIQTALQRPGVDGILATADILEDLLILGALDDKLAFASMNRGGLSGAAFELDDRFTACDAPTIAAMKWDGGKVLCRIDLDDPGSVTTLEGCGRAISDMAARRLPILVEPFMSTRRQGRVVNDLSTDAVIRSVAIASGLGSSSAYTWLKLPATGEMERVSRATTLPILLLGGDPKGDDWDENFANWGAALQLPGVRGVVAGRSLLYPPNGDVNTSVDRAATLVHSGAKV